MPRIQPAQHAVLDYAVAATFFSIAARYRERNRSAAWLAFANGAMVLGVSLLTDYPGGVWRKLSFKTHGLLDGVQAGLSGLGPTIFGFAERPEAGFFRNQALSEVGVIAGTDWNGVERARRLEPAS